LANETTCTTATELIVTEAVNLVVLDALYANLTIAPIIRNVDCPGNTKAVEFPIWNDVASSVSAPGEATDLSNTAMNPTSATVTAAEVGIMTTVTDLLVQSSPASVESIGVELGRAVAVKIDTDIAALFASLNGGSTVGTTTADMTDDDLLDSIYQLEVDNVKGQYYTILHPIQFSDLRKDIASSGYNIWSNVRGDSLAGAGWFPGENFVEIYGTLIKTSTVCPTANTAADRVGATFVEDAMAIVWKWKTRTEKQRDASLRATEVVVTACYGVGEISDARGCPITTDA